MGVYFGILWHTLAYSGILWHTLHTLGYSGILWPSRPISDHHHPTFSDTHRSSILDFHFMSHYSYIKAMMLYKGNQWTRCAGFMDASWVRLGITNDDLGTAWALLWQNLARLWHTLAHFGILLHTLTYSGTLLHTLAYSGILWHTLAYSGILWHTLAYSGILLNT